ncbi:MAG: protein-S-isoprenylcysteine O-methyltransferase [Bacteroidota bacterium]|nr:protein-S-isoprenylcysteine O-methyltransferase [Bacteroidota bacterium]
MNEIVFKITFVVLWLIYTLIRVPFDKGYKVSERIKKLNLPSEKFLILLLFFGLMLMPFIWAFTPFIDRFNLNFPIWLRLLGIAFSGISLPYFWWIHKTLGENWSPSLEIRKGHELIKTGPYKSIRHPMYLQILIWTIGQVLISSNLFVSLFGMIAWTLLYLIRVPKEEKMMIETFGEEYIDYIKQTGKIFPKL